MEQPRDFSELESRLTDTARASFERAGVIAQNQGSPYVGTSIFSWGYWLRILRWVLKSWRKAV